MNPRPRKPRPATTSNPVPTLDQLARVLALGTLAPLAAWLPAQANAATVAAWRGSPPPGAPAAKPERSAGGGTVPNAQSAPTGGPSGTRHDATPADTARPRATGRSTTPHGRRSGAHRTTPPVAPQTPPYPQVEEVTGGVPPAVKPTPLPKHHATSVVGRGPGAR